MSHCKHIDSNNVNKNHHNHYIDNIDNASNIKDDNSSDMQDDNNVYNGYTDEARGHHNTYNNCSTHTDDENVDDDGSINVNIDVLRNDLKSETNATLMTTKTLSAPTIHQRLL